MARITKAHHIDIQGCMLNMENSMRAEAFMDIDEYRSLFWEDDLCSSAKKLEHLSDRGSLSHYSSSNLPEEDMDYPEGIPMVANSKGFTIGIRAVVRGKYLAPAAELGFRPDAPLDIIQKYNELRDEVITKELVLRMWKVVTALYLECSSHEAMRYLFPGALYVLRRAQLGDIASDIETIKRVPNLPTITSYERQVLKYMNEWFAVQILLGTFEGNQSNHSPNTPVVDLSVFAMQDRIDLSGVDVSGG